VFVSVITVFTLMAYTCVQYAHETPHAPPPSNRIRSRSNRIRSSPRLALDATARREGVRARWFDWWRRWWRRRRGERRWCAM